MIATGVVLALMCLLLPLTVQAADTIEAIGGEKCSGTAKSFGVEFLAPENAQVEARAKVLRNGGDELTRTATLSIDGKACRNARCLFQAVKGQTYRLLADTSADDHTDLCVSVARP